MTRTEQLELIRRKCIEANPSKEWHWICPARKSCSVEFDEPIRLAGVAVTHAGNILEAPQDDWVEPEQGRTKWNLRKDALTEQSDECVAFLATLLGE
jgi:hypothetical protein